MQTDIKTRTANAPKQITSGRPRFIRSDRSPRGGLYMRAWTGTKFVELVDIRMPLGPPTFPKMRYWATSDGRIVERTRDGFQPVKVWQPNPNLPGGRYPMVALMTAKGRKKSFRVHRVVCEAFHGDPNDRWALHANDDAADNTPGNLRWGSPKDNTRDSLRNGTFNGGGTCRLTHVQVRQAWSDFNGKRGEVTALAERYGVARRTMTDILRGVAYADVTGGKRHPKHRERTW